MAFSASVSFPSSTSLVNLCFGFVRSKLSARKRTARVLIPSAQPARQAFAQPSLAGSPPSPARQARRPAQPGRRRRQALQLPWCPAASHSLGRERCAAAPSPSEMRLPQRRWGQAGKLATYVAALASVGGSLQEDDDEEEEFACAASLPERWQRNRHYYTRAALYLPSQSPWARVCEMPIDSERAIKWKNYAMLELTGLNLPAFFYLLEAFECSWAQVWPPAPSGVGGRPRILDAKGALALGLASLHMVCNAPSLMLCFGLPPATLSEYLSRARLALDGACDDTSECDVTWPSEVEMVEGVAAINRRHPGLARPSIPCPDGTPGGCGMWADGFTARHIRPGDKELEKLSFNG